MEENSMTVPPRAVRARQVLDWCRLGLAELRKDPAHEWIILWAGVLAFLHTVDDVLRGDTNPSIRKARNRWHDKMIADNAAAGRGDNIRKHSDKWEPAIFWQFIRKDRNFLIHQATLTGGIEETRSSHIYAFTHPSPPPPQPPLIRRAYPMEEGPFKGQDQRILVQQAIDWWESQISEIEQDSLNT